MSGPNGSQPGQTFPDTLMSMEPNDCLLSGSFEMLSVALDMALSEPQAKEIPFDVLARFANVSRYSRSVAGMSAAVIYHLFDLVRCSFGSRI